MQLCGIVGNLIVWSSKPTFHVLVIQHLNFKTKEPFHILYDHNQEWQLDGQTFFRICWTRDVVGTHIATHYLQNTRLYVLICTSLDVPILHYHNISQYLFSKSQIFLTTYIYCTLIYLPLLSFRVWTIIEVHNVESITWTINARHINCEFMSTLRNTEVT